MRLIDADELLKKTINNPLHAPYIVEKDIRDMQTIRPVVTDTNVGDNISRQAAIRWVKTECNPYGKPTIEFEFGKRVIKHLEQMPPAEPERKRYRHFKSGLYEVICEAQNTEIPMEFVIYRSLDTGLIWARPKEMFYGNTEDGKKRFEEVIK